jgi:multicomponent Na+:H+ antiporter subunit E
MERHEPSGRRGAAGAVLRRLAFFSGVWWLLVGADAAAWGFALAAIPAATAASLGLRPARAVRLRWAGLPPFAGRFLLESLLSGFDVARRALDPRLPLEPDFLEVPLGLAEETPRVLLAATVTLLPGTLTAEIEADRLLIHTIDRGAPTAARIRRMEGLVARLFVPDGAPADGASADGA